MFNCWVDILYGKIHWIVSLGGWLAAEAVLLQNCWVDILCGKILWILSLGGWLAAEAVLSTNPMLCNAMLCCAMFNCWVDILCGKIHWIVSLGGWLAAEAVLLQTLCSIAGWPFCAVKCTGLYRWVAGWLLRLCFYKPYVQLPGGHFMW